MPSGDDTGICATWDDLSNLENWNLGQKQNPSFFDACGRSRDVVYGILIVRTLRVFFLLRRSMVFRHFPALGVWNPSGGLEPKIPNPKIQKSRFQKSRYTQRWGLEHANGCRVSEVEALMSAFLQVIRLWPFSCVILGGGMSE